MSPAGYAAGIWLGYLYLQESVSAIVYTEYRLLLDYFSGKPYSFIRSIHIQSI